VEAKTIKLIKAESRMVIKEAGGERKEMIVKGYKVSNKRDKCGEYS
jgi:hypothetical protein